MIAPKFVLRGHLDDDVYETFESMSTRWIGSHRDQPDVEAQELGKAALAAASRGKTSTIYTLSSPDVVNALDDALSYYADPYGPDDPGEGRANRRSQAAKKLAELRALNPYKTENHLDDSTILLIGTGVVLLSAIGYFVYRRSQGLDARAQYTLPRPELLNEMI